MTISVIPSPRQPLTQSGQLIDRSWWRFFQEVFEAIKSGGGGGGGGPFLVAANNLSDLTSAPAARSNLGLGSSATHPAGDFFQVANNLSEGNHATQRSNLGLGTIATRNMPSASDLVGSSGVDFTNVTVGTGLNLTAGVLTATGGGGIPTGAMLLTAPIYAIDADTRTAPQTYTLRAAADDGEQWRFKDVYFNCATNNITINTTGGVQIDGASSFVMRISGMSVGFRWNNTIGRWLVE